MADPIIEQIAENIEDTITAISPLVTVQGNPYHEDLTGIRPKRTDYSDDEESWDDGDVLIFQGLPTQADSDAFNTSAYIQEFTLQAFVIDSDKAETSIDTRLNQVSADIVKALTVDTYRGNLAIDTRITNPGTPFYDDDGNSSGVIVVIEVHYRTQFNNPYAKG